MATFTKVNDFVENLCQAIDIDGDNICIALTNTAPASETSNPTSDGNGVLANITQLNAVANWTTAYTGYTDDLTTARQLTAGTMTHTQTGGTFTFDYTADIIITASGAAIATWRYIYMGDDTVTSPADPLFFLWDHGSGITLNDTDSATLQFNASGIFTLA